MHSVTARPSDLLLGRCRRAASKLAPDLVRKEFCADSVWVTTGQAGHVKFWCFKPHERQPLSVIKGKYGR